MQCRSTGQLYDAWRSVKSGRISPLSIKATTNSKHHAVRESLSLSLSLSPGHRGWLRRPGFKPTRTPGSSLRGVRNEGNSLYELKPASIRCFSLSLFFNTARRGPRNVGPPRASSRTGGAKKGLTQLVRKKCCLSLSLPLSLPLSFSPEGLLPWCPVPACAVRARVSISLCLSLPLYLPSSLRGRVRFS